MLVAAQEQEQNLASTAIRVSIKRVRLFAPTAFFFSFGKSYSVLLGFGRFSSELRDSAWLRNENAIWDSASFRGLFLHAPCAMSNPSRLMVLELVLLSFGMRCSLVDAQFIWDLACSVAQSGH